MLNGIMLNITYKPFMMSVVMLNVVEPTYYQFGLNGAILGKYFSNPMYVRSQNFTKNAWHSDRTLGSLSQGQGFESSHCRLDLKGESGKMFFTNIFGKTSSGANFIKLFCP
jgi:hypothetical protein